jgi:hypothetical protein
MSARLFVSARITSSRTHASGPLYPGGFRQLQNKSFQNQALVGGAGAQRQIGLEGKLETLRQMPSGKGARQAQQFPQRMWRSGQPRRP